MALNYNLTCSHIHLHMNKEMLVVSLMSSFFSMIPQKSNLKRVKVSGHISVDMAVFSVTAPG